MFDSIELLSSLVLYSVSTARTVNHSVLDRLFDARGEVSDRLYYTAMSLLLEKRHNEQTHKQIHSVLILD